MISKTVNEFKIGDGIQIYGWTGTVTSVENELREVFNDMREVIGYQPCTYLKVNFDNPEEVGYQYEGGYYGGSNDVVAYGYFER